MYGMGRDDVIPKKFFGFVSASGVPRNNVLFSGVLTLATSLFLSYELGVELLNFGAFIAFMGVNAAAVAHQDPAQPRSWKTALPSLLGFAVCFFIWLNLSTIAKIAGGVWLAFGMLYGASRGTLRRRPPA
jgi:amino acid transporter